MSDGTRIGTEGREPNAARELPCGTRWSGGSQFYEYSQCWNYISPDLRAQARRDLENVADLL